jgi:hypothetical protein
MSERKITKVHTFTKYLFQCFLVLVEFGGVSAAFVYITSLIVPCTTVIDCLERGTLGLALYEFLIFVILEAINDGRKDSFVALQFAYCQAILACEEDAEILYARVNDFIDRQLDNGVLNSTQIRREYEILRMLMSRKDLLELKYRQTLVDYQCNAADLRWRFTLLLRLFK